MDQNGSQVSKATKKKWWRSDHLKSLLGYLFAAACLIWVFYDIQPRRLWESMRAIDPGWIALAVVLDIVSYVIQGWRWQLLLKTLRPISVARVTQAIYCGLFANEVLPLRVGEVVRGFLVARWMRSTFRRVISSMAIERLFDGIWLVAGMGLTALLVPLPRHLAQASDVLGIVMLAAVLLFIYLVWREESAPPTSIRPGLIHRLLAHVADEVRAISRSSGFYPSFVLSFLFLVAQALAFWVVLWGYSLHLSFWAGFAVLLVVHLGTAIPNAPANIGSYQFFVVLGLSLFGVDKTAATGFSVIVFVILTIPLWALGFLALARSGTTLAAIRRDVQRQMNGKRPESSPQFVEAP